MGIRTWIFCLFINGSTDRRHVTNSDNCYSVTELLFVSFFKMKQTHQRKCGLLPPHFSTWSHSTWNMLLLILKSPSCGLSLCLECGFPGSASGNESTCQCRRHRSSIPVLWVLSLGQYSCLENPMDRGAWWAAVSGAAKSGRWQHTAAHPLGSHPKSGFMHPFGVLQNSLVLTLDIESTCILL